MDIDDLAPAYEPVRTAAPAALGVFALLFLLFFFRALPLTLDPVRAVNAPSQFDATRAIERLARVLDGTPHPSDSSPLDATRERLLREIRDLGYTPEVHDQTACRGSITGSAIRCARVQNVTFTAGPATGPALVLTAHYDSVEASPGFGDDGVGVAVWLEVARHLKDTPPTRPVLFLLTDGEETALLGAQAFVDAKAYGREVGRIINLEARGVRGPAMMFETGHPNAGIVNDWAKNGARLFSNSMMTAVYELLPNSTDLTVHLRAGSTGVNIAIADGLDFYHTQHDDLAHLDRASVQQMGDQALGATRAFLVGDWSADKPGGDEIAYSDVLSRIFIAIPQPFSLILLGLCFGVSAMLLIRPARNADWRRLDWRALLLPPALIVLSALLAFAAQWLIGLVRPEPAYWTANPQGLNCVVFLGALLASALGLSFLAKTSRREALYASGWFWFLIVGMGLSFAVPGFAMLFLIPGAVFVLCAAAAWAFPRYAIIAYAASSAVVVLMFFPVIQLIDVMMGLGLAAMFGVVEGLVLTPMLAMIGSIPSGKMRVLSVLGAGLVAAIAATLFLPAFSADRPLALNFNAVYDIDGRTATLYASAPPGALPHDIREQLTVGQTKPPPGVTASLASRSLAFVSRIYATAEVVSDETANGKRILRLQLTGPSARMIRLRIPAAAHPTQLKFNDSVIAMREPQAGFYIIDMVGRGADGDVLEFTLAPPAGATAADKPAPWLIQGFWVDLPPDALATAAARTDSTVRIQMGDVTVTTKAYAL